MPQKIRVRALAHIPVFILGSWGALVCAKGLYDLFIGEPEANAYSPYPWAYVTREQWLRYGGFELAYGLACLGLAWFVRKYAAFLPVDATRE